MRRQGPLASNGLLTLTHQRLHFVPTGRLDRMVGVKELEVPIGFITSAQLKGLEKNLVVEFEESFAQFSGKGAQRVFARLEALLAESRGQKAAHHFEPDERILVQGLATSYANGLIATRGEVLLTDRRLRFVRGGGLETLIWTFPELDHPLDAITRAEMSGVRKLLEVWVDGERRVFGGPIVPKLFNSLQAMGIKAGPDDEAFHRPEGAFSSYPASIFRGPLAHPGELVISESHVSFTPSSRLDSIVGAKNQRIPIVDLVHMEVLENKRLVLIGGQEKMALEVAKPLAKLQQLLPLLREALANQLENLQDNAPDGFDELLEQWKPKLSLRMSEPIVLTGPSIQWVRAAAGTRGWLALTDSRLLFLPASGPDGNSEPVSLELSDLQRGEAINDDQDIFVEQDQQNFHFTPLTGTGFVDAFWMLSEPIITDEIEIEEVERRLAGAPSGPPEELAYSTEERSDDHTLNRVIGQMLSLSISREEKQILFLSPAFTVRGNEGLGILLTQAPGLRFRRGELLEVALAQPEGTYSFDTLVHRMAPTPASLQPTYPDAMGLLLVEMPSDLRFHNRRQNYRIHPSPPSEAEILFLEDMPGLASDRAEGHLSNLSMGGCLIETRDYIPDGSKAIVRLRLGEDNIEAQAVCVRSIPPEDIKGSWHFAMRFVHVADGVSARINQEIVRRQREELAKKALEDQN